MRWTIVLPVLAAVFAAGSGGLVGGPQPADVNDEGVQNAINVSVVQHNRRSNDVYLRQVAGVNRAQKQVVSGIKYTINVTMAKTPCRKDRAVEVCAIHTDPAKAQPYNCIFTVWSRVWLNDVQVQEKCD